MNDLLNFLNLYRNTVFIDVSNMNCLFMSVLLSMIFSLTHISFFLLLLLSCSIFICCRADLAGHLVPIFFVLDLNMNLNSFLFSGIFLFVLNGISFALMYLSYSELSIRVSICVILLFFALLFYLIASWSISINFNLC